MSAPVVLGRRDFLRRSSIATGGLLIGFVLPGRRAFAADEAAGGAAALNAFIHVAPDNAVTFFIHKAEMGQGTVTSLSMLLAEELECDWSAIRTAFPGIDPALGNQGVYGSNSIRSSWRPLRVAGATAREMLVAAAAARWGVAPPQCRAEKGRIVNQASGASLTYGAVADAAAALEPPSHPVLKDPSRFTLIGTPVKRLDTPAKVDGSAVFGIDVRIPDMLYAVVARSPVFGGTLRQVDDTKARQVPGVTQIVRVSTGVAVVADNTWNAIVGRRALDLTWEEGANANTSSASIRQMFVQLAESPGAAARREGDAAAALAAAATRVDAVYEAPYLAHAAMEPLNCVARVTADGCDIWASTQAQTSTRDVAARTSGLPPDRVRVHTYFLGSGLGRRANVDYVQEAVEVARATGGRPVKVTWTREDDTQHDRYRPASYVRLSGGLDADGVPVALTARVVCPSFGFARAGVDGTAVEGLANVAYAVPNILVEYQKPEAGIPTFYWRSVGYSQNAFFTESFIDELAARAGQDPLELRRRLLAHVPRMRAVLDLAAAKAGWGTPLPAGRGRGLSVVNNIGSFTAQVAEVSVVGGAVKVHRVVCAVDCGYVVNPAIIEQQITSGISTGLTAALKDPITIERGRVVQSNFHDYRMTRMPDMPVVDVHIVRNREDPGGIGEAATPGIAPAVANAIFALTGTRVRRLPIRLAASA